MKQATKEHFKQIVVIVLTLLSKKVLKKYSPKIIAVTGSVGKTTTKDAVYSAIAPFKNVRKSEKSFNSEIGIPLTILGCNNAWSNPLLWFENFLKGIILIVFKKQYPDWLVLEVGADRPGDIKKISEWLKPDIVILTKLPDIPVHVEYFSSTEDLIMEKINLVAALKKGGLLIINADDENQLKAVKSFDCRKMTYGTSDADMQVSTVLINYAISNDIELPIGITFELIFGDSKTSINIDNILGNHVALACAASAMVAIELGIDFMGVKKGLSMFDRPKGRMNLIDGLKNTSIIDDSYNSSPVAVEEALNTLKELNCTGKKIIVMGDMLELGSFTNGEHYRLGKLMAQVGDILITVGIRAKFFAEGALDAGMSEKNIFQYENSQKAGQEVQNIMDNGDILLVKGSQGVRMDRFVEEVMANPELKNELLVRQSIEWENR
ncbi:MAG: Mur ligase family protein [Minisyncoccia bacterium]